MLLWVIIVIAVTECKTIEMKTSLGYIVGNKRGRIYEFVGIRYGMAPVGDLRFRPSILNENWQNKTYNATSYGPICIQPGDNLNEDEDCLFLNIWTTSIDANANLPVFFWIHGGAYIGGSGSDPLYNGYNMASFADNIVIITINYRLGSLGFLSNQQLYNEDATNWPSTGGMNGVNDQITALKWVQKYIPSFGGNANKITIFGESAGGYSVCNLLISPMVPKGIFQRAIIESGSCTGPWSPIMEELAITKCDATLLANLGTKNITILRKMQAHRFKYVICLPTAAVDGLVMPTLPAILWENLTTNNFNAKEWMIGFNSMDGDIAWSISPSIVPLTPIEYHQHLTAFIPDNKTIVNLLETVYYPLSDYPTYEIYPNSSLAWSTINGDCCVSCPSIKDMIQSVKQIGSYGVKGYVYEFRGGGYPYYANHASELAFVWNHKQDENQQVVWNQQLSDSMMSAWTNFAKYGNPNISIEWKEFGQESNVMILDDSIHIETNYYTTFRHNACNFWYNQVGIEKIIRFCCIDRQC